MTYRLRATNSDAYASICPKPQSMLVEIGTSTDSTTHAYFHANFSHSDNGSHGQFLNIGVNNTTNGGVLKGENYGS